MRSPLGAAGWACALLLGGGYVSLRRRLERVATAEHELRGPVTVLCLAHERGQPSLAGTELERLRAGLGDLAAARLGARPAGLPQAVDLGGFLASALSAWSAPLAAEGREATLRRPPDGPPMLVDRGRLAQIVGNLLANAAEHGSGAVELLGRRTAGGVRVEVRNSARGSGSALASGRGRGRGLEIATGAARALGGSLELRSEGAQVVAALDLPLEPGRRAA